MRKQTGFHVGIVGVPRLGAFEVVGLEDDETAGHLTLGIQEGSSKFDHARFAGIGEVRLTRCHAQCKGGRLISGYNGEQHDISYSALRGRDISRGTAASSDNAPPRIADVVCATGNSTPSWWARATNAGAVSIPSASGCARVSSSARVDPLPIATPKAKLREAGLVAVSTRSPSPERPISVSRRAPSASPKRRNSAKLRAISAARALSPNPMPSTMPQAMA